jgi:hypothetical protein
MAETLGKKKVGEGYELNQNLLPTLISTKLPENQN